MEDRNVHAIYHVINHKEITPNELSIWLQYNKEAKAHCSCMIETHNHEENIISNLREIVNKIIKDTHFRQQLLSINLAKYLTKRDKIGFPHDNITL